MYRDIKNIELLKYQLSKRIRETNSILTKQKNSLAENIFSTLFSLISSFLSYNFFESIEDNTKFLLKAIILVVILAVFVISYFISKFLYRKIYYHINKKKMNKEIFSPDEIELKRLIDDFDNCVCDHTILLYEIIDLYKKSKERTLKRFHYYEIFYYLNKSIDSTNSLLLKKEINIIQKKTIGYIDKYRILNIVDMFIDFFEFLKKHIEIIENPNFNDDLEEIERKIKSITNEVNKRNS